MFKFVLRRIIQSVVVFIIASFVIFATLQLLPGDPARRLMGNMATDQQLEALRESLGLNRSIIVQYFDWLWNLLHGDLGSSFGAGQSVTSLVAAALPITLQLGIYSLILALLVAIPLAFQSAKRPGGIIDSLLSVISISFTSLPAFVWGLGFVLFFSLTLTLFPSSGYIAPWENPVESIRSFALPVLALALPTAGIIARVGRSAIVDTSSSAFVTYAKAKGISQARLRYVHILKAVSAPLITLAGVEFIFLLGDAVAVETVFSLPGMGRLMVVSFFNRDYPVIQGCAVVFIALVLLANIIAEILAAWADPRVKEVVTQ
jgi:peptide/nickel transport system permease protein